MAHRPDVPHFRTPRPAQRFGRGVVASALLHGVLITAFVAGLAANTELYPTIGGPGPRGGGGGGAEIRYVELPPIASSGSRGPARVTDPAQRPPEIALPRPAVARMSEMQTSDIPLGPVLPAAIGGQGPGAGGGPGAGSGSGGGVGSGRGTGVGSGSGPGSGGGEGGDVLPPQPKLTVVPFDAPKSVRGEYAVHFFVDRAGKVTRVEVEPEIADAAYRRKFLEQMYQFEFAPARTMDGRPVDGHLVITITL